ncbi:cadherin-like beta sandwich domain-containing protein [Cohnella xylanilytica]|uniref:Cadherin-like beta sandwich domain-containing protein n=1 Tax=Cohnella xylanilytica TaxID=557555 RepID=A0A841TZB0_9BACL|nr:ZmpA/ZmpB/ZmpC family metallo-endopeptidase-related protein [Cohnella xylanilytica]MBB6691463.1 cadherin-like beta sandwich domain-containing protein [Cohnella xylanilytica]
MENRWHAGWPVRLAAIMAFGMALLLGLHQKAYAFSGEGEGNAEFPFIIKTAAQLNEMRNNLTADYRLGADIDLTAEGYTKWDPIGPWGTAFEGTLDGDGHTISNLTITGTANNLGLFGYVSDAEIRNLGLINVNVQGTSFVGGLVGYMFGSKIENTYVTGLVAGTDNVGGLAGYVSGTPVRSGQINHSYAAATVNALTDYGGLVGKFEGTVAADSSYYDKNRTEISAVGTGKSTTEMKQSATFAGWDFSEGGEGHWGLFENKTYPVHRARFDRFLLDRLEVTEPGGGSVELDPVFAGDRTGYSGRVRSVVSDLTVSATPTNVATGVSVNGGGSSETVSLNPGPTAVSIVVSTTGLSLPGTADNPFKVNYTLTIVRNDGSVSITVPANGTYKSGDKLTFIATYQEDASVTGTPRIPLTIGTKKEYAVYVGQPPGDLNQLIFELAIPEGAVDMNGITLGSAIELPTGASVTLSGLDAQLAFAAPSTTYILVEAEAPVIALTQSPAAGTPTAGAVTITASVSDNSGSVALKKWALGSRTASFFNAGGGTVLSGASFQAAVNGTYTVYARDGIGNETVKEIVISNITSSAPSLTLSASPTGSTRGPVTVTATTTVKGEASGNSLEKLVWLAGSHEAADFAGGTTGTAFWHPASSR